MAQNNLVDLWAPMYHHESSDDGFNEISSTVSTMAYTWDGRPYDGASSHGTVDDFDRHWQCHMMNCNEEDTSFEVARELVKSWIDINMCDIYSPTAKLNFLICRKCKKVYHKTCLEYVNQQVVYENFTCHICQCVETLEAEAGAAVGASGEN